jgi:hypothetical protein
LRRSAIASIYVSRIEKGSPNCTRVPPGRQATTSVLAGESRLAAEPLPKIRGRRRRIRSG